MNLAPPLQATADPFAALDWARLARPQADGYDTAVIRELAATTPSPLRAAPWRRRPAGDARSLFGGRVAVRTRPSGGLPSPPFSPAPADHPNLAAAEAILALWPEAAAQFPELVDTIQPWCDPRVPPEGPAVPGSSSHSEEAEFGIVMATVDSPFGLAQAMVNEMAHHKLRALGVSLLHADRVVTNDPESLYANPIYPGGRWPMTATLHAQYSFIHVTALDVAVHRRTAASDALHAEALYLLARNVPRMEAGREEIAAHLRTDAAGAIFAAAFAEWSDEVIGAGRRILDEAGYGMPTI